MLVCCCLEHRLRLHLHVAPCPSNQVSAALVFKEGPVLFRRLVAWTSGASTAATSSTTTTPRFAAADLFALRFFSAWAGSTALPQFVSTSCDSATLSALSIASTPIASAISSSFAADVEETVLALAWSSAPMPALTFVLGAEPRYLSKYLLLSKVFAMPE